ncbi:MAG: hypothetical protein R3E48_00615 [Burkholderiaceae bacterium]
MTLLVAMLGATGCAWTPAPGNRAVVEVLRIPRSRVALQKSPSLRLAIAHGASREDVAADRLARAGCEDESVQGVYRRGLRRFGHVLLPSGMRAVRGTTIEIDAIVADDADGPFARFFGRYRGAFQAGPQDYVTDRITGTTLRCAPLDASGRMRVEIHGSVSYWDYEFAVAEAARHAQLTDAQIDQGRVVLAHCATGVESWAQWLVRLPPGLSVARGDFLEIEAGEAEGGAGKGPPSRAIRKLARPGPDGFRRIHGAERVRCDALGQP